MKSIEQRVTVTVRVIMRAPRKYERGWFVPVGSTPEQALDNLLVNSETLGWVSCDGQDRHDSTEPLEAITVEVLHDAI